METATVIPKDKLKSCQLWQWDTLDHSRADDASAYRQQDTPAEENQTDRSSESDAANREKQHGMAEEEIAALFQQAREDGRKRGHDEGLSKGYQEGYSNGYQEGRQRGESEIEEELAHIRRVFGNLDDQLHDLDQQVAQNLLALAIDLAKKMTKQAIAMRPESVLPVVQDAVRQLPGMMQPLRLVLHPDDAGVVRQHLSEQLLQDNWEIFEDDQITPGGCRVEAGGSEIDASVETRWQRILAAIGQKDDWIEK
ncbi:MAG: flagellar assembly protein FliH [Nitrosomonas sp.]|nr:flagellar assembly protein FliH [Nitrosomonas sp.]